MDTDNKSPIAGCISGSLLFSVVVIGLVALGRVVLTLPSDLFLLAIPAFVLGAVVGWRRPRFFNFIFEILP
jgi:hypothetical protein